jgi:UDP-N-acetylglucosamine transferase subunit ALG13
MIEGLPFVFSWNINIGHIFIALGAVAGAAAILSGFKHELKVVQVNLKQLDEKQVALTTAFTQLSNVLTTVAVQDNRLQMLEKQLDEIRHGQGFIVKVKRKEDD